MAGGWEELIGDVSEDGGAARRDFVFREEQEKAGEEVVNGDGGTEFREGDGSDGGLAVVFGEASVAGGRRRSRRWRRRDGSACRWRIDRCSERSY